MRKDFSREAPCPAGFLVRLAAYLVDSILVGAGLLLVRLVLSGLFSLIADSPFGGNVLFQYTWKDIILYVLGAGYYVLCLYYTGTTVGKRLFNLRVIHEGGSGELTFVDVLYRETVGKFLSGIFLCAGYLMAGLGREKRALHDILCDTRVVYEKKIKVMPVTAGGNPGMPPAGPGTYRMNAGPANPAGPFSGPGPYQAFGTGSPETRSERGMETEVKEE